MKLYVSWNLKKSNLQWIIADKFHKYFRGIYVKRFCVWHYSNINAKNYALNNYILKFTDIQHLEIVWNITLG